MNYFNKKGGIVSDYFLIVLVFVTLLLGLAFGYNIWVGINAKIQTMDIDTNAKAQINEFDDLFLFIDKIIPFLFFALWIVVIMASIFVNPDNQFYFLISLILTAVYTLIIIFMVDILSAIFEDTNLITTTQNLTNSWFFAHNLHWISFLIMLFSSVWFYSKGNLFVNTGGNQGIE